MKRLVTCLAVVAGMAGTLISGSGAQADEKPALTLPLDRHLAIPDGMGMRFFYGKWDSTGLKGGGPITIKEGLYAHYESSPPYQETSYRILETGVNYVLLASLVRSSISHTEWTSFRVFTLHPVLNGGQDPYDTELIVHYCNDYVSMDGGDHAFHWSRERLLKVFSETCGKEIYQSDDWPGYGYFQKGWSGILYSGDARPRP